MSTMVAATQTDAVDDGHKGVQGAYVLPWLTVLVAPLLGVLLLRAPLVNVLPYRDTWFYSSYGWTFAHDIEVFGWLYYADRFSAILPIAWSTQLLGPLAGYLVLRYLIFVATGALLYACVRRFSSTGIACAAVVLLALNPFYMRLTLWDYTSFVMLPCTVAGAATWYLGRTRARMLWTAAASGLLLGAAIYANPISALALPALFGLEGFAAIRKGWSEIGFFALRSLAVLGGALSLFFVGYLCYRAYLGSFPLRLMYKPTIEFINANHLAPFERPIKLWLKTEPRIYAPVLVCAAVVCILGRSILDNTVRSRVALFAIGYTAVFWVYRFAFTGAIVETWWDYNMTAVAAVFGMPAILDAVTARSFDRRRLAIASVLAAVGLADLLVRSFNGTSVAFFNEIRTHRFMLLALVVVVLLAVLVTAIKGWRRPSLIGLTSFSALVAAIALAPAEYLGIGETGEFAPSGSAELEGYQAAYSMQKLIASRDHAPSRVLLWSDLSGFASVGWTDLPHQDGGIEQVEAPTPIPTITPYEVELLRYPTTTRILALSENPGEVDGALGALRQLGLRPHTERTGKWAGGRLTYDLIEIHNPT